MRSTRSQCCRMRLIRAMIDDDLVRAHRQRGLSPERPVTRGTAQNPDTFFQARETVNPYYLATPGIVQRAMDRFAALTGRHYRVFRYDGHPEAERVAVVMGSAAETLRATVAHLNAHGERVGVLQVLLYRPWSAKDFLSTRCRQARAASPCLTAPRNPARRPSPCVSMCRIPWRCGRAQPAATPAARRRRPLRPVVEGIQPGDGQGCIRPSCEKKDRACRLYGRHHRRCLRNQPAGRQRVRHRAAGCPSRAVFRPRRRWDGRGQQEQRQDSGRRCRTVTRKDISSTTATNPARRRSAICASAMRRSPPPICCNRPISSVSTNSTSCRSIDVLGAASPARPC